MESSYFLHGDQAPDGLYFCAICDVFVADHGHFEMHDGRNAAKRAEGERFIRRCSIKHALTIGALRFSDV